MSFQQGLSGLNASSKNLEVIGNNIANANTYGAKAARSEFADMYASSLNGASGEQAGIGVSLGTVAQQFSQGSITTTTNPLDLAINGRGFFQLLSDTGETVYSRNGQFKVDRDGFVVNNNGLQLLAQPWSEAAGRADGDAAPVQLQVGFGAAVATGSGLSTDVQGVELAINLDARKAAIDATTVPMDFDNAETYNYATSQTIFDSRGSPLSVTYYFRKNTEFEWDIFAQIEGVNFDNDTFDTDGNPTGAGPGLLATLTFDANGVLVGSADSTGTASTTLGRVTADVRDPRSASYITANPGEVLFTTLPFDFAGTTQFAAGYDISVLKQDGYAAGALTGIQFEDSGVITATYSNGRTASLGALQLANFTNVQGLQSLGGNLWASSYSAGDITRAPPTSGTFGSIQSGALEESNVDLTGELVSMITAQRVYQANAQTIKAQDQVLQTLVNLR